MTTDARQRRRTAYRNSVYIQGSAVAKPRLHTVPGLQEEPVKKLSPRTRRNRARVLCMNIGSVLFLAAAMITAGFILTWYLTLQADITNSIEHISRLESELNTLKLSNDENYSRITSNINLEEVKRIAIQELGMGYAEEGQIISFHGEGSDYVRQTGAIPE